VSARHRSAGSTLPTPSARARRRRSFVEHSQVEDLRFASRNSVVAIALAWLGVLEALGAVVQVAFDPASFPVRRRHQPRPGFPQRIGPDL